MTKDRETRTQIQSLVEAVETHLELLDKIMQQPATPERGRQVAHLCNVLETEKDRVRFSRFGLDIDYRTGKPTKRAVAKSDSVVSISEIAESEL